MRTNRRWKWLLAPVLALLAAPAMAQSPVYHPALDPDLFPVPETLVPNVRFWRSVFAEYTSQKAIWEEMVKAVRKIDSKLPIIMTAPQSEKIDELKQMYPTATCYLTMPFTTDQLRKTVTEYMPSLAV